MENDFDRTFCHSRVIIMSHHHCDESVTNATPIWIVAEDVMLGEDLGKSLVKSLVKRLMISWFRGLIIFVEFFELISYLN